MPLRFKQLEPISQCADLFIDTTQTTLHQLRDLIRERVVRRSDQTLSLLFESFGYKHGIPVDADFVFDRSSISWRAKRRSRPCTQRC